MALVQSDLEALVESDQGCTHGISGVRSREGLVYMAIVSRGSMSERCTYGIGKV